MAPKTVPFKIINGGITAPQGFECSAVECGIKKADALRLDLALLYSVAPAETAGAFTTNKVKAAPVKVSQAHLRRNDVRAIVINSGNANACTGPRGIQDAKLMVSEVARELELKPHQVLVGSTGIIGQPMPMERILPKIPALVSGLGRNLGVAAARAIMTSDTKPKSTAIELMLGSRTIRLGAMAKGAGMISPSMGTMLCFVTTDAAIGGPCLKKATLSAVQNTFNRITIDGDTSTNDTVLVMANGMAGNRLLKSTGPLWHSFCAGLEHVMMEMAKAIVRDGERVTKFVEVEVKGAATHMDARRVAETVANSLLVKCSWNGGDANWGRVMHAIGYSRARVREDEIDIWFGGRQATKHGLDAGTDPELLREAISGREFTLTIDLNLGQADYTVYTSDLSQEYVDFNRSEYAAPLKKP